MSETTTATNNNNNTSSDNTTSDRAAGSRSTTTTSITTTSKNKNESTKVKVHFVAVGSAPIMKKTKFLIGADQRFAAVTAFLRKILKLNATGSSLFLYCNSAFVPGPDELVGDLRDCFSIRDELVIHYSLQEAWG